MFSYMPNVIMEYSGAAGVPMAVPVVCSQCVSPKVKMLFLITISRTDRKNSIGNVRGIESLYLSNKILKISSPVSISMFEYIAVASAVKSFAPIGTSSIVISDINDLESFMYDGIKCRSSFIRKSSHVLKMETKLLMQLTTGRSVMGDLCTFGIP